MNAPNQLGQSQLPTAHIDVVTEPRGLEPEELAVIGRNVTKWAAGEPITGDERLKEGWQRATHDQMSPDMLNRTGIKEWFERYRPKRAAVFLVDAVGFKSINDTYGQHAGDVVAVGTGTELLTRVRATNEEFAGKERREHQALDKVASFKEATARVGGDEWMVVVNLDDVEASDTERVVNIIEERISKPAEFEVDGVKIQSKLRVAKMSPDETKNLELDEIYKSLSDRLVEEKANS